MCDHIVFNVSAFIPSWRYVLSSSSIAINGHLFFHLFIHLFSKCLHIPPSASHSEYLIFFMLGYYKRFSNLQEYVLVPGPSCRLGAVGGLRTIIQGPRTASQSGCSCIKQEGTYEAQVWAYVLPPKLCA